MMSWLTKHRQTIYVNISDCYNECCENKITNFTISNTYICKKQENYNIMFLMI